MSIKKLMVNYARYNLWANEKLSSWLMSLDRELLDKYTPSSFTSVALTVQHIQESQQFWLGIITEEEELVLPDEMDAAAARFSLLLTGSAQLVNIIDTCTEEALLEKVASTDMVQSRYEFILHTINHNSYHRGQIVTMCRHLGVVDNIPAMDYEVFLWSSH